MNIDKCFSRDLYYFCRTMTRRFRWRPLQSLQVTEEAEIQLRHENAFQIYLTAACTGYIYISPKFHLILTAFPTFLPQKCHKRNVRYTFEVAPKSPNSSKTFCHHFLNSLLECYRVNILFHNIEEVIIPLCKFACIQKYNIEVWHNEIAPYVQCCGIL